jgi:hypothetical protein
MIERLFSDPKVLAVNIHRVDGGFQVHLRRQGYTFDVAQKVHSSVDAALSERLVKRSTDLGDLLG